MAAAYAEAIISLRPSFVVHSFLMLEADGVPASPAVINCHHFAVPFRALEIDGALGISKGEVKTV